MRHITDHKLPGLNEALIIAAVDQPGQGGANHSYSLFIPDSVQLKPGVTVHQHLSFQDGPIANSEDFNGITNEALIAIVIDRLRGFQHGRVSVDGVGAGGGDFDFNSRGKFACRENAVALTHLEDALMWLQKRTRDRMARGVEGTLAK